jgi:hypothetical protein
MGTVVDINDPLKANRVKVRLFGFNESNATELSNDDLIWALVQMPCTSAGVTGIGTTIHGLKNSSIVTVSFLDGVDQQIPLVTGVIQGISSDQISNYPNTFKDKTGKLPIKSRMSEPDTNRLGRGANLGSTINANKDTSNGFPASSYAAVYPYNQVTETLSGHVIELDDTPGHERIMVWHKSGTYTEMQASGDIVHRTSGSNYNHVTGEGKHVVGGSQTITIGADMNINITGNCTLTVGGNITTNSSANNLTSSGATKITASAIQLN